MTGNVPAAAPATGLQGPDAGLLAAVGRRDAAAFAELLARHHGVVHRIIWRLTGGSAETDDIVQESFIKLWQNPSQLHEPSHLRAWLVRVASNAAIDRARKHRPEVLDDAPEVADDRPGALEVMQRTAAATTIDAAVNQLPGRQKLALILVHFEGLTNIEAAKAMELSVEAVESLLSRARRGLRQTLAGCWRELLDGLAGEGT